MERYQLEAEVRHETGKGVARSIRRNGMIPAVVYGKHLGSKSLVLDPRDLHNKLGGNAIFDLTIKDIENNNKETVMIKDIQKDPVKSNIIHIDFQYISMDEKISISVPIHLVGDAPGIKQGGILQQLLREIDLECLPINIPAHIDVDVSNLNLGDSIQLADIDITEDVNVLTSMDDVIATVVVPTEEIEEEAEEEEEEFVEPEVIGESKEGEEEPPAE
jgi:large subunit ribosomal protein L25